MLIDSETLRSELRRVRLTDCTDPDAVVLAILADIEKETAKHRFFERASNGRRRRNENRIENPCKTCALYVGDMCEHVCEERYDYIMKGGADMREEAEK